MVSARADLTRRANLSNPGAPRIGFAAAGRE